MASSKEAFVELFDDVCATGTFIVCYSYSLYFPFNTVFSYVMLIGTFPRISSTSVLKLRTQW
jgi:hypothetical protein